MASYQLLYFFSQSYGAAADPPSFQHNRQTELARLGSSAPPQLADGSSSPANSANSRAESADPLEVEVSEAVRDETLLLPAPPYAAGATAESPRADENWPPADASSPWAGVDLITSRDAVAGGVDEEEQAALMDELNNDLEVPPRPIHVPHIPSLHDPSPLPLPLTTPAPHIPYPHPLTPLTPSPSHSSPPHP